jgi:hypothetical protein
MPLFKVGDYVERVDQFAPPYVRFGRVVRVIPNVYLPERYTEYEVDFSFVVVTLYETQLRLTKEEDSI